MRTFGGSAFKSDVDVDPLLIFRSSVISLEPTVFREFTPETPRMPVGGWFQGAVLRYGKGRAAFFGEAGMFFAVLNSLNQCPEVSEQDPFACRTQAGWPAAEENPRLLLNVLHWLSNRPGAH